MAERKTGGIFGTVKADQEMGTGLREGTKVKALGTLDDARVVVRVLSDKLPAKKQMVTVVPKARFNPDDPDLAHEKLKPYKKPKK